MSLMLTKRIYNGLGIIILRQKGTLEVLILVNGIYDVKDKSNYDLKINDVIDPKQLRNLLYLIRVLHHNYQFIY